MKKNATRILVTAIAAMMLLSSGAIAASAAQPEDPGISTTSMAPGDNTRDTIVKKTRIYNGKLQYRRYNVTTGEWVDPDWIDMP